MERAENKQVVYEFGRFVLDPRDKTLLVDGVPVHLPAKEFETLLLLVQSNRRALSKEEMMSAVWQDAFVEEGNLAKQVSKLRKILNTDGEQFIETLPKHGYRFSADVRQVEIDDSPVIAERRTIKRMTVALDEPIALPSPSPPALPARTRRTGIAGLVAVTALLLLVAFGLFWIWNPSTPVSDSTKIRSIAVLPFKPVGSDVDDEYLRIGVTDAVVTKLSGLKQVIVRPTNAVRAYADEDPLVAGRTLGVDVVLDGNIQRIDQQMRLTVQLISVADGAVLWAGTFDEHLTNIFQLQDAISEQVAHAIQPGLTGEERSLLTKRFTASNAAHAAYVKGRISWNRRTANDLKEAVGHFGTAIKEDPNYALAHVGLADTYSLLADYGAASPHDSYPQARAAATRALELDDQLAEAHTSLAYVKMYYEWDWTGSENEYRRAISLNPNYATARQWYSEYLTAQGRFDEALTEIRRAKEIDPLSPVINAGEVWVLYFARRYDEAIEHGRRLAETDPRFAEVHEYLKRCYDAKGMYGDAIESRQMRRKLVGLDSTITDALRAAALAKTKEDYWPKRLEQELEETKREGRAAWDLAEIYAQLGQPDLALEWLTKAVDNRHYFVMYVKVAPNLDPLRIEPGYAEVVGRMGL